MIYSLPQFELHVELVKFLFVIHLYNILELIKIYYLLYFPQYLTTQNEMSPCSVHLGALQEIFNTIQNQKQGENLLRPQPFFFLVRTFTLFLQVLNLIIIITDCKRAKYSQQCLLSSYNNHNWFCNLEKKGHINVLSEHTWNQ